jgi:hypothetical protein
MTRTWRFTLKKLPAGLFQGEVRIELSNANSVRLFKDDGTVLFDPRDPYADPDVLWFDLEDPDGKYLAGVMSADVDIWLEGLDVNTNFQFSYVYDGQLIGWGSHTMRDKVHMLIAEWEFRGLDETELFMMEPIWKDALLAAADDGPWTEPIQIGIESYSFYKVHIEGLPPAAVAQCESIRSPI